MSRPASAEQCDSFRRLLKEELGCGLSQAKLAILTGIDPAFLSRILSGKKNPSLSTIQDATARLRCAAEPLQPRRGPDELDVMRDLEALPDDARARVLAWAAARWP